MTSERIIRESERLAMTGISRTTCWQMEKKGEFPKRIQIGPRAVGWLHSQIQDWIRKKHNAISS
ncbi:helix-turn-helix transcriptional regulator [Vibrio alfacsensis]|uniref:helix-turn-helix transcriptional regulator n=1 Tax=Vibrio alfacsensis TaxID=1074311 RepID=UPI0040676D59